MTKIPRNIKPKNLLKKLKSLGFEKVGARGSHVRLKHVDGRWTQIAVHQKAIPTGTLKAILKQVELDVEDIS